MPDKIELTEEELQEKINEAVKQATNELITKHNDELAKQRIKASDDKKKAVEEAVANANLSAEEKAKKELEEQRKADLKELEALRLEKKINDRAKKLQENGLPDFFKNDTRLLNATDEKVEEVIKTIKEEYTKVLPTGAVVSTNVLTDTPTGQKSKEEAELERVRGLGLGKNYV